MPLGKICFEITESDALRDEEQAIIAIEQLRKIGCTIALDDFGTGYASFDYLRRLPLDIIKIDGSFVQEITHSDRDKTIVQAISQVAKTMNLTTVAEFVESEQHADILCDLGIDYAQGFGIAKPLPLLSHLKRCQKTDLSKATHFPHQSLKCVGFFATLNATPTSKNNKYLQY